jgi:hypothetical protein
VHRTAQRVGVAVALEEIPARANSLVTVGADAHDQFGIAGLNRRLPMKLSTGMLWCGVLTTYDWKHSTTFPLMENAFHALPLSS